MNNLSLIQIIHFIIIVLVYCSPFLADWNIILIFIFIYYVQLYILGECILTKIQFGKDPEDASFYSYIFTKLGFTANRKKVKIIVDYLIPWIILLIAMFWQIYLNNKVIIDL